MRRLLSDLVGILSNLGLRFGQLRQSQRTFARVAAEIEAAAAQLAGAISAPETANLAALAARLREVASAAHDVTSRSETDLEHIRREMLRATELSAALSQVVLQSSYDSAQEAPHEAAAPLERHLREVIVNGQKTDLRTG